MESLLYILSFVRMQGKHNALLTIRIGIDHKRATNAPGHNIVIKQKAFLRGNLI
jgi:hypothetical protein